MEKTRYEKQHIKHGKVYHAMFWIGSHMPEEAAHSFILFIQTVQVSLAMLTRFLHPRTTTHSHQLELQFILGAYSIKKKLCCTTLPFTVEQNLTLHYKTSLPP